MFDKPVTDNNENKEATANLNYEEKALAIENEETDILKSLLKKQNKQLFYTRITGISMVIFVATIVVVCMLIVPEVLRSLSHANNIMVQAEETIEDVQHSIKDIDAMTAEITSAAKGVNTLVDDNASVLNDAMTQISSIDFAGLNNAITDLQNVVEPLAKFMSRFR